MNPTESAACVREGESGPTRRHCRQWGDGASGMGVQSGDVWQAVVVALSGHQDKSARAECEIVAMSGSSRMRVDVYGDSPGAGAVLDGSPGPLMSMPQGVNSRHWRSAVREGSN
jgi:hypothetical protein